MSGCFYVTIKVHELTHTDNKRHMCPVCGKKYADVRCFQKHIASHTTDACSSSFSSSSSAKPTSYECNMCSSLFSDVRTLRMHIKIQHFDDVQSSIDVQTQYLDQGQSSSTQGQCYFCGQCGQELTVHMNTSDEIVLSANCSCSEDHITVGSHPSGVVSFADVDEVSLSGTETELAGETCGEHDDLVMNELQVLHSPLAS